MLTRTAPAAPGGVRPQTRYAYTLTGITHALTSISSCQTGSSCAGTVDALTTTIAYGGASANSLPASVTSGSGNGAVPAPQSYTFDNIGHPITIDGPLPGTAATTDYRPTGKRSLGGFGRTKTDE